MENKRYEKALVFINRRLYQVAVDSTLLSLQQEVAKRETDLLSVERSQTAVQQAGSNGTFFGVNGFSGEDLDSEE